MQPQLLHTQKSMPLQNQNPFSQLQQSYQQYSQDQVDIQTAQFIKTTTLIQNTINNNNGHSILQNSSQSSANQQKKPSQSSNVKKSSLSKDPLTLSINHMIMQNQSICQENNEESMDKSYISQGNQQSSTQQRLHERLLFKKKIEKTKFKDILRSRNILFLAILMLIYQADSIYVYEQVFTNNENSKTSKIFFYLLVIAQSIIAVLFILLGCKKNDFFQSLLKQKQLYFGCASILVQVAYHESIFIALDLSSFGEQESDLNKQQSLSLLPFRLLNILVMSQSFQLLIRNNYIKIILQLFQLFYFSIRFFFIRLTDNYIQFAVCISTSIALYIFLQVTSLHNKTKKKLMGSNNFQRLLNTNNGNTISNNNNIIILGNGQPSAKGSPPEKSNDEGQDLKQQSFNNNNISLQGIQPSFPYILNINSNQMHSLQKQQSLNINSNNKIITDQQILINTNNNQIISYNSLNGSFVNLEKPGQDSYQSSQQQFICNNKRSQFRMQTHQIPSSSQQLLINNGNYINQNNNASFNNTIQNIIKSEKQHQMSKISELDLENDFSKHHNNNSNNPQNGFISMEQRPLIDQLIEVDGVVVFEQETQQIVFANQNILTLLETDANKVLSEVMSLKQIPYSVDEKTPKDADYSTTNLLKNLFKDQSINPSLNSPVIASQNNSSKVSNKVGSNPFLKRVIEEENEQDQSPYINQFKSENGVAKINNSINSKNNEPIQLLNSFSDKVNEETGKPTMIENKASTQIPTPVVFQKPFQQRKSLIQNNSFNITKKKDNIIFHKSRSQNYKANPLYFNPNAEFQGEEDDDNQKGRVQKNESQFKKLSAFQNHNPNPDPDYIQHGSNNELLQQNLNEPLSFLLNRHNRESLDFPSFISSISQIQEVVIIFLQIIRPRKSTIQQNSLTTIERERNNTLKDIMDDVRSKSGTFLAQQRKSTITTHRKKTLNNKRQLNYSQQPETIINNMVLFKEHTTKIYLMKYSIVEHAGKILHIICIRDLSNEVFEQILERQSSVLIDELYKYLNFTEISSILNISLKQMKALKYKLQLPDYKVMIQPIKLNLRQFNYLMNDIFDARSLQHKNFLLNKDYFDLQQELLKVKKMTETLSHDIVFNFYYDKLIPIQILNDKERISQILMNLLANSCKLVKNNKIFLKAKMCKDSGFIKIIIQNRELNKTQKEQILKAFSNQTNSLGYHFFISNLLAKQVSNQKHKLEIITNKQEYIKFKFHIYLFTQTTANDISQIQLIKNSTSTNNTQNVQNGNRSSIENQNEFPKQSPNSLSHFDLDDENEENSIIQQNDPNQNKVNESPPTHLDKGQINETSNLIKDSKQSSNDNKQRSHSVEKQKNYVYTQKKTINFPIENPSGQNNQDNYRANSIKTISNEGTEISEHIENTKIKDFDNIQIEFPMKFISDLVS